MGYLEEYKRWLKNIKEKELLTELKNLKSDEEIKECFYKDLEFGTGGLRGIISAGTDRMNIYTVMKATSGYSNYLKKLNVNPSVAISYDSRNKSELFARKAAEVFSANNIKVYIFDELMPTPLLSFAVRELQLSGGIAITASHNPAKYNGYKVYGSDGCQITCEAAEKISNEIEKIDIFENMKCSDFDKEVKEKRICYIGKELINKYIFYTLNNNFHKCNSSKNLKIVYTPLNGTGLRAVKSLLNEAGYNNIEIPKEQEFPDINFTTCKKPNPEEPEALELAIGLAKEHNADFVLATDPDCDRIGTAVKDGRKYRLISGQEMGVLLFDYICIKRLQDRTLPFNPVAIKTIVTTDMADSVAKNYNVTMINVLTGFKYIGEQIGILERENELNRYIFGFEESYGYLTHTKVRDKDAIDTALTICEMVSCYKEEGISLITRLNELYEKYGYFVQKLKSFEFTGADANVKMDSVIDKLRKNPLKEWNNNKLISVEDYEKSERYNINGEICRILLPKSNVIKLIFENNITVTVRPSGTEPKLKMYYSLKGISTDNANEMIDLFIKDFQEYIGV